MSPIAAVEGHEPPAAPRQRLPAAVRINQILDAALEAFATRGFAATSIDDIAALAGMSKGGVYTHFDSKDELFEALLERALTPMPGADSACNHAGPVTVDVIIHQVINPIYDRFSQRETVLTLRLLLADGARMPERVARWRQATVLPYLETIEYLLNTGVAQGSLRRTVLNQAPWLLISPGVHAMLELLIQEALDPKQVETQRNAHIALARELLEDLGST